MTLAVANEERRPLHCDGRIQGSTVLGALSCLRHVRSDSPHDDIFLVALVIKLDGSKRGSPELLNDMGVARPVKKDLPADVKRRGADIHFILLHRQDRLGRRARYRIGGVGQDAAAVQQRAVSLLPGRGDELRSGSFAAGSNDFGMMAIPKSIVERVGMESPMRSAARFTVMAAYRAAQYSEL